MKKAFTMIELIFVIVILGILAAVALPRFLGVAQQAHEGNLKAFVGTLNRTVAPTLWSKAISKGYNGDISQLTGDDINLSKYIDIPKEIDSTDINLSVCNDDNTSRVIAKSDDNVLPDIRYVVKCQDGNANKAPKFSLYIDVNKDDTVGDSNTTHTDNDTLVQ